MFPVILQYGDVLACGILLLLVLSLGPKYIFLSIGILEKIKD